MREKFYLALRILDTFLSKDLVFLLEIPASPTFFSLEFHHIPLNLYQKIFSYNYQESLY